jgi:ATP-dependent helicase HrpB
MEPGPRHSRHLPPLPIDALLPEVVRALRERSRVVLEAAPGAGKTTRLPLALLDAGFAERGEIVVLQPRRIAARLAAHHVSELLQERVGRTCGYQVRFESKASGSTRIRYMTEALLTQRMRSDPQLRGIACVVLDEFHERHVATDLNLALLRRLQQSRDEALRLVVMSATLDGERIADHLECPRLVSKGRQYPVDVLWADAKRRSTGRMRDEEPLARRVARALRESLDSAPDDGHVLVFLPGVAEIRRAAEACQTVADGAGLEILPLHGDLPVEQQHRAVTPGDRRKLVLATNVAETSLTIDGVTCVIDSGLVRRPSFDPWSGLPVLELAPISRASAVQRMGRAGRTAPGRCIRLYTRADHAARPEHDIPELQRLDLTGPLLDLCAANVPSARTLEWLDPPPEAALASAERLLHDLGALDASADPTAQASLQLSEVGRAMLRFPVHPRQARLLVEGERRGIGALAAGAAALLSERPLRRRDEPARAKAEADVLVDLDDLERALDDPGRARGLGVDLGAARQIDRVRRQLSRLLEVGSPTAPDSVTPNDEEALLLCLLSAYPDRVARVRDEKGGRRSLLVCGGVTAELSEQSALGAADWALALALQEHRHDARPGRSVVRSAARIELDWLMDLFADRIEDRSELVWNAQRERVEARSELTYGGLTLDASIRPARSPEASAVLARAAREAGPEHFVRDAAALASLLARVEICAEYLPEFPSLDDEDVDRCLSRLCEGLSSFGELRKADLVGRLRAGLGPGPAARLDRFAPEQMGLPGRRRAPIHYERGKPAWLASRLQDFFGLSEGPRIGEGRISLVLHLLAPNQRAVQVTTDLPGFWERHYPALRKTLMRRYPRHAWPEDPLAEADRAARSRTQRR